jgi:cytochrome bd-type quinol oxidase subunit 1
MTLDPLILSRLQFVWVIGWHILLPALTIGLASFIAAMEGAHVVTGREALFHFFRRLWHGRCVWHCDALPVRAGRISSPR